MAYLTHTCVSKKGATNGHPKVASMANITFFINKLATAAILDLFRVPIVLFVPSFGDVGKLQKL